MIFYFFFINVSYYKVVIFKKYNVFDLVSPELKESKVLFAEPDILPNVVNQMPNLQWVQSIAAGWLEKYFNNHVLKSFWFRCRTCVSGSFHAGNRSVVEYKKKSVT